MYQKEIYYMYSFIECGMTGTVVLWLAEVTHFQLHLRFRESLEISPQKLRWKGILMSSHLCLWRSKRGLPDSLSRCPQCFCLFFLNILPVFLKQDRLSLRLNSIATPRAVTGDFLLIKYCFSVISCLLHWSYMFKNSVLTFLLVLKQHPPWEGGMLAKVNKDVWYLLHIHLGTYRLYDLVWLESN